ncbi:MAG TPA: DUF6265 family protein [Pedobacter sp.]|uniref:DUF6265 family protein n=1 Tax=Pedobacter sp. TaxID=1411316 RepID=UPI002D16500D|nr:DUF6265 family protein [Pedobacter sp.]HMI01185.1 DUF6265 family protein [Pedobacter sp.]
MKIQKLLPALLLLLVTDVASGQEKIQKDFKKLEWLQGRWERINSKPGQTGIETWAIVSPEKLTGTGLTMKGTDTLFLEKLELVIKDGYIYYVADVEGNPAPVLFKFTEITNDSFICENPLNDFPKKIAYRLQDKKLKATISGGGKSIAYDFVRKL